MKKSLYVINLALFVITSIYISNTFTSDRPAWSNRARDRMRALERSANDASGFEQRRWMR